MKYGLQLESESQEQAVGFSSLLHETDSFSPLLSAVRWKRISNAESLWQEKVVGKLGNQEMAQDKERVSPVPHNARRIIGVC